MRIKDEQIENEKIKKLVDKYVKESVKMHQAGFGLNKYLYLQEPLVGGGLRTNISRPLLYDNNELLSKN